MNVNLTNFSVKEITKYITNHYEKFIKDQLTNYMKPETDSKLQTFAKCYKEFKIQLLKRPLHTSKASVTNLVDGSSFNLE
jgi:hypothetical protein